MCKLWNKFLVICGSLFFCFTVYAAAQTHYMIVVDAGSSGSRLHIFAEDNSPSTLLPKITDLTPSENTVHPGIASFVDHPQDVGSNLQPLIDKAQQVLTQAGVRDLSQVDFNLMATAGMRLLPKEKQTVIYTALQAYLVSHSPFKLKTLDTITGKMEGIYGWLAVNYLENNFKPEKQTTMGSMDMGGASTQIVFSSSTVPKVADKYSFLLAGKVYHLFSHSFLGLGQDQARASVASLACYPKGYSVPGLGIGQFNYTNCRNAITQFIVKQGIWKTLPIIPPLMKHVAYSGYYYTTDFFAAKNLASLAQAVQNVCTLSWDELQKRYPKVPTKYLANYCFNGAYIHQLLIQGYGFNEATQQIDFEHQIASSEIDWSLGVAVADFITLSK